MYAINCIKLTPGIEKDLNGIQNAQIRVLSLGSDESLMKIFLENAVESYIVDHVGKNNYYNTLPDTNSLNSLIQKHSFVAREIPSVFENTIRRVHVYRSAEAGWVRSHKTPTLDCIFSLCKVENDLGKITVTTDKIKTIFPKNPLSKITEEITTFDHSNLKHVTIDTSKTSVKQPILPIIALRHVTPDQQNIRETCIVMTSGEPMSISKKKD